MEKRLLDERALHPRDVVTLVPPGDIHTHGHVIGTGSTRCSLILLGDNMLHFEHAEFDQEKGRWRRGRENMTRDNIAIAKGPVASWVNKRSEHWWVRYYEFRY